MTERLNIAPEQDSAGVEFELASEAYLAAYSKLVDELKRLDLAKLVLVLRRDDAIGEVARQGPVFNDLADTHFPGTGSRQAFEMLLTMGLRFVKDEDLAAEIPKARAWIYRDFDEAFGLEERSQTSESPQQ
jgi:hypothetical protein